MTRLAFALALAGTACDITPCSPAIVEIHEARCAAGDADSCHLLQTCNACGELPGCEEP